MAESEGVDLTKSNRPPTAEEVERFHENADTNSRKQAIHHTIGISDTSAAAGNHRHRGGDSEQLLAGVTITGSRATDAWRLSVEQALVALGATSTSTP